jgi:hypothetical protein
MSCECDTAEVYSCTVRKARKRHRCDECGDLIQPNEQYHYASGIYDREPFSFHLHQTCADWRQGYSRFVRSAQEKAVIVVRRYESRFNSYVGSVPPVFPSKEEALFARSVLDLCDCIEMGRLREALREIHEIFFQD